MQCRCLPWLVFSYMLITAAQCPAADLDEAIEHLKRWQKKIVSIRVQSRETTLCDSNSQFRSHFPGVKERVQHHDWAWEFIGNSQLEGYAQSEEMQVHDGVPIYRNLIITHPSEIITVFYPREAPLSETPVKVEIASGFKFLGGNSPPMSLVISGPWWLGDRLARKIESDHVSVTNTGLLQVDLQLVEFSPSTLFLDPQHGYLPCRVNGRSFSELPDDIPHQTVDEFREIEPGFWFPWKGRNFSGNAEDSSDSTHTWEVTQVDLNTELPLDMFQVPMGVGTHVDNSISGNEYIITETGMQMVNQRQPSLSNVPAQQITPLRAWIQEFVGWRVGLLLLGVGGVVVWFAARHRARCVTDRGMGSPNSETPSSSL